MTDEVHDLPPLDADELVRLAEAVRDAKAALDGSRETMRRRELDYLSANTKLQQAVEGQNALLSSLGKIQSRDTALVGQTDGYARVGDSN